MGTQKLKLSLVGWCVYVPASTRESKITLYEALRPMIALLPGAWSSRELGSDDPTCRGPNRVLQHEMNREKRALRRE